MRPAALAGVAAFILAPTASAAELNASLIVAPLVTTNNSASPYYVGPPAVPAHGRGSRQDLELRLREGGLNVQGTLRWQAIQGATVERHGIANQIYYDGELGQGLAFTVGKKVMSWGVGFGFRPLDIVQRENRRGVNLPALVGQPLLAVEKFDATDAWTLAWVRPGAGGGGNDSRDGSLALRWYRLAGGDDLHAVARLSHRRGVEAGAGFTRVAGDAWAFHGAALYQRRYRMTLNALAENSGGLFAASDPMTETPRRNGIKAVVGAQWTGASGWSVLAEAWYDADAYSRAEWRRLDALVARQRAQAGMASGAVIGGNIAWSSTAYLNANLLRENLLLRLAYDDRDGLKPYAELLATPRDDGRVLTFGVIHEGNRQRIAGGLRRSGGAADSAYARAPVGRMAWIEWRMALF